MTLLVVVTGCTNAGKTTFLDYVSKWADTHVIDVGRELRKRHPPEYFKGSAAPEHTRKEAWEIFSKEYEKCKSLYKAIFTSGQPRDVEHALKVGAHYRPAIILNLFATEETRRQRAESRDLDEGSRKLTEDRMHGDYKTVYHSLSALSQFGIPLYTIDATQSLEVMFHQAQIILRENGVHL